MHFFYSFTYLFFFSIHFLLFYSCKYLFFYLLLFSFSQIVKRYRVLYIALYKCIKLLLNYYYNYKQQYCSSAYEGPKHKKNRHIAYKQLVRPCWGALGKNIRVPLPTCAVNCIRAHFPEPNQLEEDMSYSAFTYADE